MNNQTSRRGFIKKMALGSAALYTPEAIFSSALNMNESKTNKNSAIQIALIGAGGMGTSDTRTALTVDGVKLVAVCDLYNKRLEDAKGRWATTCLSPRSTKKSSHSTTWTR